MSLSRPQFQSHAGSIEAPYLLDPYHLAFWMFQSHAGSIEAPDTVSLQKEISLGFNPTLVRLRPAEGGILIFFIFIPFQSHAGSIEALPPVRRELERSACFNPTLVRLRPLAPVALRFRWVQFQSHAGSIEAGRWT